MARPKVPPPPAIPALPPVPAPHEGWRRRSLWQRLLQNLRCTFEWIFFRELPCLQLVAPSVFRPDFTWGHRMLAPEQLAREMPPLPPLLAPALRRLTGHVHSFLCEFSRYYYEWFGLPFSYSIAPLPFGVLLKRSDGTSLDELQSMRAIRAAGVPCPRVISYGEHPHTPWAPVSILMTRLPGEELDVAYEHLSAQQRNTVTMELHTILEAIRSWKSPWGRRICSISGGPIRSIRVPNHVVRPCESEDEFQEQILSTASSQSFKTRDEYETTLATARAMPLQHAIVFTHGDFALHNILVYNGRVSGFIDWESAGWYPEYWEFTTPLRWTSLDSERGSLFLRLGGHRYKKELESELAIRMLTVDSWISV